MMSVATVESKIARLKEKLRVAYDELRAEREKVAERVRSREDAEMTATYKSMERFCDTYMECNPGYEYGLDKLPIRPRFVLCALAAGVSRKDIASQLPKINGKLRFVRMGITTGGLHKIIEDGRRQLRHLNRGE
jgi:hypothetical protein